MARTPIIKRQVRGFVITWSMLTLIIAGMTFFGIYLTYAPAVATDFEQNVAFPTPTEGVRALAQVPATDAPTLVVTTTEPTIAPTATIMVVPTTEVQVDVRIAQAEPTAEPSPTTSPTPAPTLVPILVSDFELGIQIQPDPGGSPVYNGIWMEDVSGKLGMNWIKIQLPWVDAEPVKGEYDFRLLRQAILKADEFGIKVMLSIVAAPDWAREPGVSLDRHGPPADTQDFVDFLTEVMNRFGTRIHAIEVWNEQNLDREWTSVRGLRAEDYVDLLRQSYQAIKAIDPNMIVISGALSTTGGCTNAQGEVCAIDDFAYFDAMIAAGMLNYTDCVGAHHNGYNMSPEYTWDNVPDDPTATFRGPFDNAHHSWSFRSTLEYYANKVAVTGGTQKLCVTEFGWASGEGLDGVPAGWDYAVDNTLAEQADWTIQALDFMKESGYVRLAWLWNLNFGPNSGWAATNDNVPYSIIGPNFSPRPVFNRIGEWSAQNQVRP